MSLNSQFLLALRALLPSDAILMGTSVERAYECDAYSVERSSPEIVVLPSTTNEVAEIVRLCNLFGVPFTPRGAGTGLSGGALAAKRGLLLSTKRLNQILKIDLKNRMLHAQTGVPNQRISDAVAVHGLHFAPDPSSQSVSTLGGNIAENSGGPHTLKYGITAQHILSVTMVNPTGQIVELGSLCPGGPGPDPLGLVIGGEGTLGIVTEAWVRLTPIPLAVETLLVAYSSVRDATETVAAIVAAGVMPAALEMMDHGILAALKAAFGLEYPEGTAALLLIECDGPSADQVRNEVETVERICQSLRAIQIQRAQDAAERTKLWTARKKGIGAMGRLAPTIVTHDGVIPRSKLPEMLEFVSEVAARHGLGVANLFHAGDGNLHPCFYFDEREPGIVQRVVDAGTEILDRCLALGGSITGEHGIGVEKIDLMQRMFSADDLRVQGLAKSVFNEGDLCNPCKVLPNQKGCLEHQKRWRGAAW